MGLHHNGGDEVSEARGKVHQNLNLPTTRTPKRRTIQRGWFVRFSYRSYACLSLFIFFDSVQSSPFVGCFTRQSRRRVRPVRRFLRKTKKRKCLVERSGAVGVRKPKRSEDRTALLPYGSSFHSDFGRGGPIRGLRQKSSKNTPTKEKS